MKLRKIMASSSLLVFPHSSLISSNSVLINRNRILVKGKIRGNKICAVNGTEPVEDSVEKAEIQQEGEEIKNPGVIVALSLIKFYRREISPMLMKSCRFVPTCSEYSMEAYKKYGFTKGTILMTWRICRCNPFGGTGYDPPRWFDEERAKENL